ncbi:cupin domain-containing protein [Chitinophagaceae bacterium LWZ2-11]
MPLTVKQLVELYQLQPHPEGGYYKETYRSCESIATNGLPERFGGERQLSTAIYFLLDKGNFSGFHRIKSDECWHFYAGQTLYVHILHTNGQLETILLGNNPLSGERFQAVVPAGCWFASEPASETEYAFVGCTVAPGFDFTDFELAKADELSKEYPEHSSIIRRLCRQ